MSHEDFVPPDLAVPARLEAELFTFEPLGPEQHERDYDAWTSSQEHIHADDFRRSTGFASDGETQHDESLRGQHGQDANALLMRDCGVQAEGRDLNPL